MIRGMNTVIVMVGGIKGGVVSVWKKKVCPNLMKIRTQGGSPPRKIKHLGLDSLGRLGHNRP